ncbi:MAG: peptide-methionine (S)-S-oxide reductase MsrA [Saprospiraceae bacterium]
MDDKNLDITLETTIFASGCFWCTEAIFQNLVGVHQVRSGYIGGDVKNPSYREICSGTTGHAEAIEIKFDPSTISYEQLLEIFWSTHDPTTLNRQGGDHGTQYRSAIFYSSLDQKIKAEKSKVEVANKLWSDSIVTEIIEASIFYPAEDYHQNYYNQNSRQSYCQFVINPKLNKLKAKYSSLLK